MIRHFTWFHMLLKYRFVHVGNSATKFDFCFESQIIEKLMDFLRQITKQFGHFGKNLVKWASSNKIKIKEEKHSNLAARKSNNTSNQVEKLFVKILSHEAVSAQVHLERGSGGCQAKVSLLSLVIFGNYHLSRLFHLITDLPILL